MLVNYQIQIGQWSADQSADTKSELIALSVRAPTSGIGIAGIAIYAAVDQGDGILDQAAAAATNLAAGAVGIGGTGSEPNFSTKVRGNEIKDGDAISITLTAGDFSEVAFAGEVLSVDTSLGLTKITGVSGARNLAISHVNQVFENQSSDQIISDLAGQAGATVGQVSASISYPYLVIDETRSVFDHIKILAMHEGMECYFNANNELTVERFAKTSADHEFHYGIHILDLETFVTQPGSAHTRVYTESPASTQGQDTWHWLTKDSSAFQSEAGSGANLLVMSDGAVRTKDAADQLAANKHGAIKDISTRGRVKLLGNPAIKIADAIKFNDVPKPELNGLFKVTGVEHRFSKLEGYLTIVDFTGLGGADAASDLLGGLGGLAGAVGF